MSFSGAKASAEYPRVVAVTVTDQTLASGEFAPGEIDPSPTADLEPPLTIGEIGFVSLGTDNGVVEIQADDIGPNRATTIFRGRGQTYTFESGDPSDEELIAEACGR